MWRLGLSVAVFALTCHAPPIKHGKRSFGGYQEPLVKASGHRSVDARNAENGGLVGRCPSPSPHLRPAAWSGSESATTAHSRKELLPESRIAERYPVRTGRRTERHGKGVAAATHPATCRRRRYRTWPSTRLEARDTSLRTLPSAVNNWGHCARSSAARFCDVLATFGNVTILSYGRHASMIMRLL